jgi:hypothetical protein
MKCTAIQVAGSYSECVVSGERKKKKKFKILPDGISGVAQRFIRFDRDQLSSDSCSLSLSLSLSQLGVIMYLS